MGTQSQVVGLPAGPWRWQVLSEDMIRSPRIIPSSRLISASPDIFSAVGEEGEVTASGGSRGLIRPWSPIRFGNRVWSPTAEKNNDCKGVEVGVKRSTNGKNEGTFV